MSVFRASLLLVLVVAPASAQRDSALTPRRSKPLTYFFESLAIPGWGQANLDRKFTGGLFMAVEGISLGMGMKAHYEIGYLQRTNSNRLKDRRAEQEDWFFLLGVNHLLAGMEAFVSASLYDFPADLRAQSFGDGRKGIGVSIPLGHRP